MRKPRPVSENTYYHIYNRVNNHRSVNLTENTYDKFLDLLRGLKKHFSIDIYCYCLMTNHYHIFLKTNKANLSEAMKYFGEHYARYINKYTNASGPVFTSRFKSKLVEDESYFLQLIRYIHLNPENSSIGKSFLDYPWSSIHDYLDDRRNIIRINEVLDRFISLDDFINYHQRGNSEELSKFYNKKCVPNTINDETVY